VNYNYRLQAIYVETMQSLLADHY